MQKEEEILKNNQIKIQNKMHQSEMTKINENLFLNKVLSKTSLLEKLAFLN